MTQIRFLTAGESHGKWLVGIIEGIPAGVPLSSACIQRELSRRKLGFGRGARQNIETDAVEIASGVRHGKTLGSPIALLIQNQDFVSWKQAMSVEACDPGEVNSLAEVERRRVSIPRPGHADFVGALKYGHEDMRNVLERASARETASRVALGAVARIFLEELGITIASRVTQIGSAIDSKPESPTIPIQQWNPIADSTPTRCLDQEASSQMVAEIERAKKAGDTLGGVFEVVALGLPVGLGSYAHWDRRLEGPIAQAFMSLNAIKGVEIGLGFGLARVPGTQAHDELFPGDKPWEAKYRTNRAGGLVGGMTTGQPLIVRAAMKPIATLMNPLQSFRPETLEPALAHVERSDVCAVPSAAVIGESLLALVLAESVLNKFGGDNLTELRGRIAR